MITQKNRTLKIATPLGEDILLLKNFRGVEGISMPFAFELELISEQNHNIDFKEIIGQNVTVSIDADEKESRYFNGIISAFSQHGTGEDEKTWSQSTYSATLVPSIWLLKMTSNIRIFQNKTIPEIVEDIVKEKGITDFEKRLTGDYSKWEYCVQYRETDFNFISRLLEQVGIYYFFVHENGKHTMVLADSPSHHDPLPLHEDARLQPSSSKMFHTEEAYIHHIDFSKEIRPARYSLNDFNFKTPNTQLAASTDGQQDLEFSLLKLEVYDAPGEYSQHGDGETLSRVRMEEEEAQVVTINGTSSIAGFTSGYKFRLLEYFREEMNGKHYVLTSISHAMTQSFGTSGGSDSDYSNSFHCIPVAIPFRPQRKTPKPVVEGVSTAIVVGQSGEEIHTDEFGRVKVQFHWDRQGQADENSSCWIRVSQPLAGQGWGAMFLPRIGQEVIVSFVEGDPDRPIITGRVYHGLNMPPYPLPDNKTMSGFKTNSSKGGDGFNEIRFEDKKGEEQLFFHAEKDQDIRVKHDRKEYVGNERHMTVETDQFEKTIASKHTAINGDLSQKIDGNIDHTLGGNKTVSIAGNQDLTISGDVKNDYGGDYSLSVGGDDKKSVTSGLSLDAGTDIMQKAGAKFALESGTDLHLKAGTNLVLEAGVQISLKVGGNMIDIGPVGVTVKGANVFLDGSVAVFVKGGMVNINTGGGGGSAASGCGCSPKAPVAPDSPDEPTEPLLPGEAAAGAVEKVTPVEAVIAQGADIPQVKVFKQAAQSGAPLCET